EDVVGNGMAAYSFRFSTGAAIDVDNHLPVIGSVSVTSSPSLPGSSVAFTISASDSDVGDALEYRFDAGDGTDRTPWQASNEFSHTYQDQGHYNVIFQVRDGGQVITSSSRKITIAAAAAATLPTASSQLITVPADGAIPATVWAVNPDNNTITRIDATSHTLLQEIQTGADPRSVARASDGSIWVACHDSDELWIYQANGTHLQTITLPYGSAPVALCATPDAQTMLCSLSGSGRLVKYDASTRGEVGNIALGPTARAIAVTADGQRALVTRFISPENHGEVWDIAVGSFTLTRTIPLLKNRGGRIGQDNTGGSRGVPNYLGGITLSPDNSRAWIASKQDNTDRGLLTGSYPADLTHDSTVRAIVSQIDLTTNREVIDNTVNQFDLTTVGRIDVDNASMPKAIAFSPLGDYMFVAMEGNNAVMVYDSLSFENASSGVVVARIAVGLAPQSLIVDPDTNTLWVKNFTGRSVSALDISQLISIGSVQLPHTEIKTVANESLSAQVLLGKQVFYNADDRRMSAEAYISCASCHADGGHDGRNWDFTGRGEGLRNTISLHGRGGAAHGRMHWTANFDEVQDFENDIRNGFGGTGFLADALWNDSNVQSPLGSAPKSGHSEELDAMAAYLTSLASDSIPRSPYRHADGSMTDDAVAGQAHFTALNCASCHVPETGYRDGVTHDVGTFLPLSGLGLGVPLTGLDTPTLIDIPHTAPYLHHGVAESLEAVFRIAGGTTYEAESLTPIGGGVTLRPAVGGQLTSILINFDNTSYSGFAELRSNGSGLQITNADGGSGGPAGLLIRAYSTRAQPHTFTVVANPGTADESTATGILLPTVSSTGYRHLWIEGLALIAGPNNTINITANASWPNLQVDQVTLANTEDLDAASAHRSVQTLSAAQQEELMAYIRELGAPSPALSPEQAWRANHFPEEATNETISGMAADPDGDGLNNGLEFFMGTDPTVSSTAQRPQFAPHQENGINYLRYTFQRDISAMGHLFTLQKSFDLSDWFYPNAIIQRELSRSGNIQQLEILVPDDADEAHQFIRLLIDR
ncbi:MAG: PKD domain-containing protein, partial [Akkermansiaceae bacterium]